MWEWGRLFLERGRLFGLRQVAKGSWMIDHELDWIAPEFMRSTTVRTQSGPLVEW